MNKIHYHLTPGASQNNAFTAWRDGSPSCMAKVQKNLFSANATAQRERFAASTFAAANPDAGRINYHRP